SNGRRRVTLLAMIVVLAMAVVLLWAAMEKLRTPDALAATIGSLGVPASIAQPAARSVGVAELIACVALLFRPDALLTQLGVLLLAALFGLAGLLALRLDEPIPCSCFGA